MTTYFITRHSGAIEWAKQQNLSVDIFLEHITSELFQQGDCVIGTLPINLIYELQNKGVTVLSLILDLPRELRGQELTLQQLISCKTRVVNYLVTLAN
jgi:CRISPR-associated protein Csx16